MTTTNKPLTLGDLDNSNVAAAPAAGQPTDGFQLMQSGKFIFRTPEEAQNLAGFIARCFPDPERAVKGLAELMLNAIEHGNLGIGYQMKAELCRNGHWKTELDKRLQDRNLQNRFAEIALSRQDGGIYIVITDQGQGFDWKSFIKIDPARAGEANGRGIAMASALSFDQLTYNEKGNKAVAFVADQPALDW